nr:hypothetical protein [Microbacterium bovistercoris]
MTQPDVGPAPMLRRTKRLKAEGWTDRGIRAAVADGGILRLRQGAFGDPATDQRCLTAARLRGRLTCVTELRRRGIFVLEKSADHVHIDPSAARRKVLPDKEVVHRRELRRTPHPDAMSVEPFDAPLDAVMCQEPRAAIASIDSALHHGLLPASDVDELFQALPRRFRRLRHLVDASAESGPETFVRLILRALVCSFQPQVVIPGVGRVDFLVDGWLIIECDSKAYHSSWDDQLEDRRRDLAAAERGYVTLRIVAADILGHPDKVRTAIAGILRTHDR